MQLLNYTVSFHAFWQPIVLHQPEFLVSCLPVGFPLFPCLQWIGEFTINTGKELSTPCYEYLGQQTRLNFNRDLNYFVCSNEPSLYKNLCTFEYNSTRMLITKSKKKKRKISNKIINSYIYTMLWISPTNITNKHLISIAI